MQQDLWLPLTEYALRTGVSISTLRRKIKSNSIEYKMDEGRYLVRCDKFLEDDAFQSTDMVDDTMVTEAASPSPAILATIPPATNHLEKTVAELEKRLADNELRWRAIEARVVGLAKRLDVFSEQISETKMLVKIFEEKLDNEL